VYLARCALLVDALEILLEATVCGIHLSSALVQFCELVQHNVLMVSTSHRPAIALGCCIKTFNILMLIAVANRYLQDSQ
jgi:hypothetical protein